jgi:hypothetical protein
MQEPNQVTIGHERVFLVLADDDEARSPRGELWSMRASLTLPNLRAQGQVWLSGGEQPLGEFFDALAADWRGWDGQRRWEAHEGGLTMVCTNDARGHITISVELWEHSRYGWVVRGDVPLDAGQLEAVARHAHRLFAR